MAALLTESTNATEILKKGKTRGRLRAKIRDGDFPVGAFSSFLPPPNAKTSAPEAGSGAKGFAFISPSGAYSEHTPAYLVSKPKDASKNGWVGADLGVVDKTAANKMFPTKASFVKFLSEVATKVEAAGTAGSEAAPKLVIKRGHQDFEDRLQGFLKAEAFFNEALLAKNAANDPAAPWIAPYYGAFTAPNKWYVKPPAGTYTPSGLQLVFAKVGKFSLQKLQDVISGGSHAEAAALRASLSDGNKIRGFLKAIFTPIKNLHNAGFAHGDLDTTWGNWMVTPSTTGGAPLLTLVNFKMACPKDASDVPGAGLDEDFKNCGTDQATALGNFHLNAAKDFAAFHGREGACSWFKTDACATTICAEIAKIYGKNGAKTGVSSTINSLEALQRQEDRVAELLNRECSA